jgi:Cysteine-rich secretory protein family
MKQKKTSALTALAMAASFVLAACGGGGGDSSGNSGDNSVPPAPPSNAQTPTSADIPTPQFAQNSAQLTVFQTLNAQRQQCGLPALVENTTLDQAAQAHAAYMAQNGGTVTDTEVATNPGFTGAQYVDRDQHFGFPANVPTMGVSGGFFTNATLTEAQYGQQIVFGWLGGVYHMGIAVLPTTNAGIGWNETTFNGFPEIHATLTTTAFQPVQGSTDSIVTFPCQGTTGVAFSEGGETPVPPNTVGNFGTPVAVNSTDTAAKVLMQTGTMTDTNGNVINLQVLDSTTAPNKELLPFEGRAYPVTPLQPNTAYTVTVTFTVNGKPDSRNFTFTTGNVTG